MSTNLVHAHFRRYEGAFAVNPIPREPALHASAGTDDFAAYLSHVYIFGEHLQLEMCLSNCIQFVTTEIIEVSKMYNSVKRIRAFLAQDWGKG